MRVIDISLLAVVVLYLSKTQSRQVISIAPVETNDGKCCSPVCVCVCMCVCACVCMCVCGGGGGGGANG